MNQMTAKELKRDCPAVQIPSGEKGILPQGTTVYVTQALGSNYTVRTDFGLYRISSNDADALGFEPTTTTASKPAPGETTDKSESTEQQAWDILRNCYDPEIPVNIVDLGLVYDMAVSQLPSGQSRIDVKMTLTAPGCGMGPSIAGDAQQRLIMLDGVEEATVEIVWDPPWHQSMITAEGRRLLGLE
ncbi:MAG TPA: putative Fe-S cluster assembly protein SufT [Verrucomicrobiae bacterium]|nr:putative Fe-S cluster assembly protein SufT [Verrucomicrobiae bacterium]